MVKKDKSLKNLNGLELACRFSSITNRLRYCGPKDAYRDFYLMLNKKEYDKEKIISHFSKYEGLYVYLDHLAKKFNKNPFDYDVVESYWLGNKLLDSFTKEDNIKIIKALVKRGLPKEHASFLIKKTPVGLIPHHSFNVLFIGVGKTTGSVPTNVQTMNKCIVSSGRVLKIMKEQILVSVAPLVFKQGELIYGKPEIQYIEYIDWFLPNLKPNDIIAIHWDFACKILTDKDDKSLKEYTSKNIETLNHTLFFSND